MACWGPASRKAGCPCRAAESRELGSKVLGQTPASSAGLRPVPRVVSRGSREALEKNCAPVSPASSRRLNQKAFTGPVG